MLNLVANSEKAITYRATRPTGMVRVGKKEQPLAKIYKMRDSVAEAKAVMAFTTNTAYKLVTVDEALAIYESDKTKFTSFTFIKVDDLSLRTICTKKWSGYVPVEGAKPRAKNPDQYSVLDTNIAKTLTPEQVQSGRAIRSFNKNTLVSMQHNGILYIVV